MKYSNVGIFSVKNKLKMIFKKMIYNKSNNKNKLMKIRNLISMIINHSHLLDKINNINHILHPKMVLTQKHSKIQLLT